MRPKMENDGGTLYIHAIYCKDNKNVYYVRAAPSILADDKGERISPSKEFYASEAVWIGTKTASYGSTSNIMEAYYVGFAK